MIKIYNPDDLEKLKTLQDTKSLLKAERLKEKLGKQGFHFDIKELFEPVTENQKQNQIEQQGLSINKNKRYMSFLKLQHKEWKIRPRQ